MAKLVYDLAQQLEDSFYQSFKPADAFLTIDDFALKVGDETNGLLEEEFLVQWKINQQRGNPYANFIHINPFWLKRITVDIKEDKERHEWYAEICEPIFEFPMDEYGNGVQDVKPYGQKCAEFVRILNHQIWQYCLTATSPIILYVVENCRIKLLNFDGACTEKLDVLIVPSQSAIPINERTLPDGKASEIYERVMSRVWRDYGARLGKIDMTNDGNENAQPIESGAVYDNLKTK